MKEQRQYYHYWSTQKGHPIDVILKSYRGLRGYNGYIQTKEYDGVRYAGEVWDCISVNDGDPIRAVFRIPYDELGDRKYDNCDGDRSEELQDYPNYHTDGILAYTTNRMEDRDQSQLLKEIIKLQNKIIILKEFFDMLSNQNPFEKQLKWGVQLYLRRLENPNRVTSREWKHYCKEFPKDQMEIIRFINEQIN